MSTQRPIRVLIVDDSAFVRKVLSQGLGSDPGIEVVGACGDAFEARDRIVALKPDVLTLDIEMPKMDGLEFLERLMPQYPIPVVVISSLSQRGTEIAIQAMELGAVDVVGKPEGHLGGGLAGMMNELKTRIKLASTANVSHWKHKRPAPSVRSSAALARSTDRIIAIGASTGGTEALRRVLQDLPAETPGIVVVQHMPPGFTRQFADRLNTFCAMSVKEAATGDRIMPGRILIAPGAVQLRVRRSGGVYEVVCAGEDRVKGHCPSVDVMMKSVAEHAGRNAVGVVLTGMGSDGAEGLLAMRTAGARTLAQDEATSVVYGMPREALVNGGAERALPIDDVADAVLGLVSSEAARA